MNEIATGPADVAADLRLALTALIRQLRRQADAKLPAGAVSALAVLDRLGPLTSGELARHENVSGPMVTKISRLLEDEGLVARTPDPADGRVNRLSVTPAGARVLQRNRQAKNAWLTRRVARLDAPELEALQAAIPVLQRLAERDRP